MTLEQIVEVARRDSDALTEELGGFVAVVIVRTPPPERSRAQAGHLGVRRDAGQAKLSKILEVLGL